MEREYQDIEKRILAYCEKHHLFVPGDKVVLGVSGGADSVCLLFALHLLSKEWNLSLYVVHVDHGIRKEAAQEAAFVRQLCENLGIPFFLEEANVPELAKIWAMSIEEAGRKVRYTTFQRVCREVGGGKIAVAHHQKDLAETVLFQLFRGSGIRGLAGIRPKTNGEYGEVVHPLLCLKREEIEEYLASRGQAYCTDESNFSDRYTRNRIRLHVLPYVEKNISVRAEEHLCQTAEIAALTSDYIRSQVDLLHQRLVTKDEADEIRMSLEGFEKEHPCLQQELIYGLLRKLSPQGKNISYVHVKDVCEICLQEGNRQLHLPHGLTAVKSYAQLCLTKQHGVVSEQKPEEIVILPDDENEVCVPLPDGAKLILRKKERDASAVIPTEPYTKWFDYDKLTHSLVVRTRQPGDFMEIAGEGDRRITKKLQDLMVNLKIPSQERDRILLLVSGNEVVWMIGYRISELFKVSEETATILEAVYLPKQ